jgi:hypothetical protein
MRPSDRVVERGRGCYSCKSFENGHLARQQWRLHRLALVQHFEATPPPVEAPTEREAPLPAWRDVPVENSQKKREETLKKMDHAISNGTFGMCMKGKRPASMGGPEGDFVHCAFLCDRWNGRDGASIATQGKKLDKLPGELREIMEDKAKRRS